MRFLARATLILALTTAPVHAQEGGEGATKGSSRFLASPGQVVAIRAGRLFDARRGVMLANQTIVVRGDRIAEIGTNPALPPSTRIIDLSRMTVLPGMVDVHVHVTTGGATLPERAITALSSAQADLQAGFTTILDMDSRGGFLTVDLRDAINKGLVEGPRMQVVGQSLNYRGARYVKDDSGEEHYTGRTEGKDINGPWLARAAVREAKYHGVDMIKIYTTQDYAGPNYLWKPDGSFTTYQSLTLEEVQAIVDESHRLGLKVACHSYDGRGTDPCLITNVDAPNHLLQLDDAGVRLLLKSKAIFVPTIDDLIALEKPDLAAANNLNSRMKMMEGAFKRARAAHIPMAFGSGATSPATIPHGVQANQFAVFVKWGMTPAEALQMTYIESPRVLNYHWENQIGTIETGKFADIIAVSGDPLVDVTEMERVKFVMKGGVVVRPLVH